MARAVFVRQVGVPQEPSDLAPREGVETLVDTAKAMKPSEKAPQVTAAEAIAHAVRHHFERRGGVPAE